MARNKKKKENEELVVSAQPIQNKIVVEIPVRKTTKEIHEELLLSLAKLP